jgi:hypothetical protein
MMMYPPSPSPKSCDARLELSGGCTTGSISRPGCKPVSFQCTRPFGHRDGEGHSCVFAESTMTLSLSWHDVAEVQA